MVTCTSESKFIALHHIYFTPSPSPDPCPLPDVPRMCQTIIASTPESDCPFQLGNYMRVRAPHRKAKLGIACREKVTPTSPSSTGALFLISIVGIWGYFQDNRSHSAVVVGCFAYHKHANHVLDPPYDKAGNGRTAGADNSCSRRSDVQARAREGAANRPSAAQ